MFRKSNVNKKICVFLVSLKYIEFPTVKIVRLYKKLFLLKVLIARKRRWN